MLNKKQIVQLDNILKNQLCWEGPLKDETTLDEMGADDLDAIELLMDLEKQFDFREGCDDKFFKCKTVGEIREYLDSKIN